MSTFLVRSMYGMFYVFGLYAIDMQTTIGVVWISRYVLAYLSGALLSRASVLAS